MMLVLTYDVDTASPSGAKRLRQVAKLCERYGVRVQNSVFEVMVDPAQLVELKTQLQQLIDVQRDSVRLYRLGKKPEGKIETLGRKPPVEAGAELIF